MTTTHPVLAALRASGRMSDDDLAFLEQNGREYEGRRLPSQIKRQAWGSCFANADDLALRGWGAVVLGFGIPAGNRRVFGHSWVSNQGSAIDATWDHPERNSYFGSANPKHRDRLWGMSRPFVKQELFGLHL